MKMKSEWESTLVNKIKQEPEGCSVASVEWFPSAKSRQHMLSTPMLPRQLSKLRWTVKTLICCYSFEPQQIANFMAWLLSTPALPSRQVYMADSWWMNFSPIWKTSLWVQDIWKNGEYFKWLLSSLDRKSFQQLVFKAVNNRKRSGYVDFQRGQIDWPKSAFLQTQATQFETVMTTVDEVSDKTKVADEILRSVLLDCFTA